MTTAESTGARARAFALPDLGEGLTDAEVVAWRVQPGDHVDVDQVVVDVETAKATVEVPCPFAGRVVEVHAAVGESVPVGSPLVTIADEAHEADPDAIDDDSGSGAVLVGYGTAPTTGRRRRLRGRAPTPAPVSTPARTTRARVISPVVRRLADSRGIDLADLTGSGPAGVIVRRDVESARADTSIGGTPARDLPARDVPTGDRTVLRGIRRTIADHVTRSRREIPDATTWVDVDATALLDARAALREARPDQSIGLLALLARFVVAGLRRFPDLNTSVEADGDDIVIIRHPTVNLGFAAQTERGLVVPVVHGADTMTLTELAAAITDRTAAARTGSLAPAQLTGGTFTLNNYGVFGVDGSTPIVNHPEAALLGVGRIAAKPWVVEGELAVRQVTQLSLTFDHRVCDGGVAGGFLRYVADCVEGPVSLLADV